MTKHEILSGTLDLLAVSFFVSLTGPKVSESEKGIKNNSVNIYLSENIPLFVYLIICGCFTWGPPIYVAQDVLKLAVFPR